MPNRFSSLRRQSHDSGTLRNSLSTIDLSDPFTVRQGEYEVSGAVAYQAVIHTRLAHPRKKTERGVDLGDFAVNITFASLITSVS